MFLAKLLYAMVVLLETPFVIIKNILYMYMIRKAMKEMNITSEQDIIALLQQQQMEQTHPQTLGTGNTVTNKTRVKTEKMKIVCSICGKTCKNIEGKVVCTKCDKA